MAGEAATSLLERVKRFFSASAEDLVGEDAPQPAGRTLKEAVDGRPLPKRQLRDEEKRPYPPSGGVRG